MIDHSLVLCLHSVCSIGIITWNNPVYYCGRLVDAGNKSLSTMLLWTVIGSSNWDSILAAKLASGASFLLFVDLIDPMLWREILGRTTSFVIIHLFHIRSTGKLIYLYTNRNALISSSPQLSYCFGTANATSIHWKGLPGGDDPKRFITASNKKEQRYFKPFNEIHRCCRTFHFGLFRKYNFHCIDTKLVALLMKDGVFNVDAISW